MSAVADLVEEFAALGIELWEDGGSLRFRAPRGALTEPRRALLRGRREELLDYLRSAESATLQPDPDARGEAFPLTDIQASYVLGRRSAFAYGGVGCHAYGELVYPDLHGERVAEVWKQLVGRHDMLRAVIDPAGSQRVLPEVPMLEVGVQDLRGAAPGEVEAAIAKVRAELDHRIYEPQRWPLFEVRVTRADDHAVLHLSIDFLVADFVSIRVLLDEFHELYHRPERTLEPLDITFRDYLLGERRLRGTRQHEIDREYWWQRVDSLPPAPDLPLRGGRSAVTDVRFRRHSLHLPTGRYAEFKRRAAEYDLTPSAVLLTAYAEVVGRWSRRRAFSLNLTLLSRWPLHPQVDRLVGDFTSVVVLEVDAGSAQTFGARAKRLQAQLWQDMDHRLVGGVEVLREIARRRGQGAALLPVVFTSALGLGTIDAGSPVTVRPDYGISQTPQVWIDCQALEYADGLTVNWDVREGVFPEGLVEEMFEVFSTLLGGLAGGEHWDAEQAADLPRRQRIERERYEATEGPLPDGLLHDGLVARCARAPDAPAVLTAHGSLTCGDLLDRARRVATAVRAAGGRPGDVAAIVLDAGPDQVVAVLGAMLAGCVYLPIDTRQPPARRGALIKSAGATVALVGSNPGVQPEGVPLVTVDAIPPGTAPLPLEPTRTPDDLAYVIYTSGSTGKPKGVMITHRAASNTVGDINRRFAVGPRDRVLGLASLAFDLSVYDIFGPIAAGGALVLPAPERRGDPSHWAELVAAHEVTLWNSVPAQMQMLSDYLAVDETLDLPSLRLAMLSGDWIPVPLPDQVRARLPALELVSLGGATEGSIWSIFHPIGEVEPDWASIPYGRPLTNQTMHVLDELGRPCPEWTVGELYIGGAGVAAGYLGDEELTARRFVTDPGTGRRLYRTGDLGRFLPGGVIEFLGREDLQVKVRGHRIELAEIETCLQEDPAIGGAAVVVQGEGALDRRLVAFVEPARIEGGPDRGTELVEAIDAAAREALAGNAAGGEQAVAFARQLDRTALVAMADALRRQGLFATPEDSAGVEEVLDRARVSPKHHRLIRRWLRALERNELLRGDPQTGRLSGMPPIEPGDVEAAWERAEELKPDWGERTELIEYFRVASRQLGELMRDEVDPVQLLFPEGRMDIQESAYQGNFLSSALNRLVVAAVCTIAERLDTPLRLLEVGAGVGGASIDLVPALAAHDVEEYLFTDVSQFFVNRAKERFAAYPWMDYGLFDLNVDYREQGLSPNSYDVILCANVLHYARHAGHALERFRELLRPGGWLVFIETTRDNYQILTSMEFLFDATVSDFEDVRADRDETFVAVEQWHELLAGAGADPAVQLSESDEALSAIGMHVFAARFKAAVAAVDPVQVRARLGELLPEYMVPARLEVLDSLPLTGNDKVDRKALAGLAAARAGTARTVERDEPAGALEGAVASVWSEVLGAEQVGRGDTIFELGGDSLLAAQLVGRMREAVPEAAGAFFDELLRDLLEGATVASIAERLSRSGGVVEDGEESVVFVIAEHDGGGVQLLLPDAGGSVDTTLPRARTQGKVLGGRLPQPKSYLELDPGMVPEILAARFAAQLRSDDDGFLALLGQDFGGLLAFEVARQLAEAGQAVHELTMVVTAPDLLGSASGEGQPPGAVRPAGDLRQQVAEHSAEAQRNYRLDSYIGDVTVVLAFDTQRWPEAAAQIVEHLQGACFGEVRVRYEDAGGAP